MPAITGFIEIVSITLRRLLDDPPAGMGHESIRVMVTWSTTHPEMAARDLADMGSEQAQFKILR
ncbi:MAG: hypothetical protein L0I29_00510 [Hyphomicrobiales bacterium]|nr:hypothetical protein [Hyphomicrobiales bacterium]